MLLGMMVCGCPAACIPHHSFRAQLRVDRKMLAKSSNDFVIVTCCSCCALIQEAKCISTMSGEGRTTVYHEPPRPLHAHPVITTTHASSQITPVASPATL
jgi:hypothetical protein